MPSCRPLPFFMILHPKKSMPCSTVCRQRPSPIQRAAFSFTTATIWILWGNTNLMTRCHPGDIFGESYAIRTNCALEVSLYAEQNSTVLYLNVSKMMTLCSRACEFHNQLTRNLLSVLAERNFQLGQKLEHMTKRTTREKLLSYLSSEARRSGSSSFDIPFNRQQLADYLSVDRSAMSNELCHLRDEGLISFQKNHFTVQFPSS